MIQVGYGKSTILEHLLLLLIDIFLEDTGVKDNLKWCGIERGLGGLTLQEYKDFQHARFYVCISSTGRLQLRNSRYSSRTNVGEFQCIHNWHIERYKHSSFCNLKKVGE